VTNTIPGTELLNPNVLEDPYPFYRRLRSDAPVWKIAETGVYTVSTFELLAEASSRVEDFSSNMRCLLYRDETGLPGRFDFGDAGGQALATADPPLHPIHRKAVFPDLVARRMELLEPDIIALADALVSKALQDETVEFMTVIGNVVPITMISRLIGFRDSNLDDLWRTAVQMTTMIGATKGLDELMTLASASDDVQAWVAEQLARAMEDPSDDILGAVAGAVLDEVLTDSAGIGILMTLLSAGGETTTSLLGNSVRILAEQPELQGHLRGNLEQVPTFVEEALRLESPFRYMMRWVPQDTSLGGVDIPADSTLLLLWGSANRDAKEFAKPDEVDLGRRLPRRHVAFGRGIHHCVGAHLARIEARNVLTVLLSQTDSIALVDERQPRWAESLLVRRHKELPVRLHVR
jgi:cytochrome P450